MSITINGSGTIGGVSVGGLPDGIVDTDMLASNAVTSALLPAGSILQVVSVNGGYVSWTASGLQTIIGTTSITVRANSKIFVTTTVPHYCGAGGTWGSVCQTYLDEIGTGLVQESEHAGTVTNEAQSVQVSTQWISGTKTAGTYSYILYGSLILGSAVHEVGRSNRKPNITLMEIAG